jgi:hypothetical protein
MAAQERVQRAKTRAGIALEAICDARTQEFSTLLLKTAACAFAHPVILIRQYCSCNKLRKNAREAGEEFRDEQREAIADERGRAVAALPAAAGFASAG